MLRKTIPTISLRLVFMFLLLGCTIQAMCQETYKVVSTSVLNVRSKPTTKSFVIGKLKKNEEVKVFSIENLWAEIFYKNRKAYVFSKYLKNVETAEKKTECPNVEKVLPISVPKEEPIQEVIINPPKTNKKIGIDFLPTVYGGFVNLVSDRVSPKGNFGGGVDFSFQFFVKEKIAFFPRNYYMETSLGYSLRGCGHFPLHYIMAKISPIGYSYKISKFELYGNIGTYVGYTFSTIETNSHSFDSNIDWGIWVKVGVEYKKIGLGFSYERGMNNVCNSNLKLMNQGMFFNASYRLFNLK